MKLNSTTKSIKLFILTASLSATAIAQDTMFTSPQNVYNDSEVVLTKYNNGGVVNASVIENVAKTQPEEAYIKQVTDGVWAITGYHFGYKTVIEGETGLIIYDSGDDIEEATEILELVRKHISEKPIHTVIYSHSHYVFGAQAIQQAFDGELKVIGHPEINKNVQESGGLGASIPELSPTLTARAYEQFSVLLPAEGPDAKSPTPIGKTQGFVPVNTPVTQGQTMTVDGVEMVFYTDFDSDTDDQVIVYLPESKTVLNNHLWPTYPNFYTLRGSVYRDPTVWAEGIRLIRDLNPEHLINTHTEPLSGHDEIQTTLNGYYDGIMYLYDQTIRGILQGKTPEELTYSVQLPQDLAELPHNQMTYGEFSYYPKNIYYHALGWFNGEAETLNRIEPNLQAKKIIEGFGGVDAVKQELNKTIANNELAWSAELGGYLVRVVPNDEEAKQLLADTLRQMGYQTEASIPRSWYLTKALELEGKVQIPSVVFSDANSIIRSPAETLVGQFRVRLDPIASYGEDQMMAITIKDSDAPTMGLHVRSTVAEFISDTEDYNRQADLEISVSKRTWAEYFVGEKSLDKMLESADVSTNHKDDVRGFFSLFDQLDESKTRFVSPSQS
ncbi:alkyl sulfatase dimerization domain-containing protein [Vibrio splendidus]|uniref:alkyl sulfatase dimerization domain-containing protein n=1 Tax=Vibrio splendidus TaxID=29497 RepID=UPI001F52DF3F|nr:alkyl sulfatase dimerization domain-containing protein [Vibrio splendidus]